MVALLREGRLPDNAFIMVNAISGNLPSIIVKDWMAIRSLTISPHRVGLVIVVLLNNSRENGSMDAALLQAK
jgi:hypothetical protein